MATTKKKKGWREIPLIARLGLVIGSGVGLFLLWQNSKKPDKVVWSSANVPENAQTWIIKLAGDLKQSMAGTNIPWPTASDRSRAWAKVAEMEPYHQDFTRFLHNYWIENIDEATGIYDWIYSQQTIIGTPEATERNNALRQLIKSGVGQ